MQKPKSIFLIFSFLLLGIIALFENNLAIIFWGVVWMLLGHLLIRLSTSGESKSDASIVFNLFFFIYLLFSFVGNLTYVNDPYFDYFFAKDSTTFYQVSEELGSFSRFKDIFSVSNDDYKISDYRGFAILIGVVSYVSKIIDENSILVQKLIIVFTSSIILAYFNLILKKYFTRDKSFKYIIIYGVFSYSLIYSGIYLRDTIVGFLYILAIYQFFCSVSLNRVYIFALITGLCMSIRVEHGIFSIIFLTMYIFYYLLEKKVSYKYLVSFPFIIIGVIYLSFNFEQFVQISDSTTDSYLELSVEGASESSLGLSILKLPWGVRHLAGAFFSQTMPFPFYASISNGGLGYIPEAWAALFWFYVWVFILYLLFNKKYRITLDKRLLFLFIIAFMLVLGGSINSGTRRIMAVYPIFFLLALYCYNLLPKLNRQLLIVFGTVSYAALLLIYVLIKG